MDGGADSGSDGYRLSIVRGDGGFACPFLADVSGSMQDHVAPYEGSAQDETKAAALKKTLLAIHEVFDPADCEFGIYRWRYLAGHPERYVPFLEIGDHEPAEFREHVREDFLVDYQRLN